MGEELLDQVNEQDEVIGTITRSEAHQGSHTIHREVGILIVDSENRVLMHQRSHKKQHSPLLWIMSACGHVPAGVDPMAAAHTELQEELGFDTPLTYIDKAFYKGNSSSSWCYMYLGTYQGEVLRPDPDEIEKLQFFTQKEWEELCQTEADIDEISSQMVFDYWEGKLSAS